MKRFSSLLAVLLAISLLCACNTTDTSRQSKKKPRRSTQATDSLDLSLPTEETTDCTKSPLFPDELTTETTGDPFVDISAFDSTMETVLEILGTPTNPNYYEDGGLCYEDFSYLGMTGNLIYYYNDIHDNYNYATFTFMYPGASSWKPDDGDDSYSPTSEDLRIAQENWDKIVAHYTALYGEPARQISEKIGWLKKGYMGSDESGEFITIETGYSTAAFRVYSTLTYLD